MDRKIASLGSAFVAKNLAQKILANYYFKFIKPVNPLKVVGSFDEGLAFINETYELYPIQ